jgi:hypothetical protein
MDVTIALQRAVQGFPLGTAALAARLSTSVHSLNHKVSPTYPGAHCSPEEALQIMQVTGDHGALHAQAMLLGYVLLPAPVEGEAHGETAMALARSVREFGEFVARVAGDLADGLCTANELADIQREGAEAQAAMQQLLVLAQQMHDAGRVVPELRCVEGGR